MKHSYIEQFKPMSMRQFLAEYVNEMLEFSLTEESIFKLEMAKATHQDITELNIPFCKRIPNDIVTDDMLLTGDVLLVADFRSTKKNQRVAPYMRPSLIEERVYDKKKGRIK